MTDRPYVDVSHFNKTMEFSLHNLKYQHLVVLRQAITKFINLADDDLNLFANKLEILGEAECELLVDYCFFRKMALELKDSMEDVA